MTAAFGAPPVALSADERQWRRGVRATGALAAAMTVAASVHDLDGSGTTALLLGVTALWLVELFATPSRVRVEVGLLVAVGLGGAVLNGAASDSAGFLFAYFAAAATGLRLPPRTAAAAIGVVVLAMAVAIVLRDGEHTATSLTTDVLGVAFAGSVTAATRSAREAHARAAQLLAELERSRAAQAEAAALGERARLAREIHDVLAHSLSGQVMSLEAASMLAERTGADERVRAQIDRAHHLARNGLVETRQAIGALRGDHLPGPGLIPDLVRDAGRSHGLAVTLEVVGEPQPLAPEAGLTLYRAVQEALTNTAKHAGPGASAAVLVRWQQGQVELTVTDHRRDARPPALPASGYGLSGLRERAELAGGALSTTPTDDGFRLHLTLPCDGGTRP